MDAIIEKSAIRRFMRSRAPESSLAHPARALLSRYVDIAEACAWPLARPEDIDAAAFAKHLSRALAVPVNDVRFASLSSPYADMEWTTADGFARLMDDGLSAGLDASAEEDVAWTYWGRLQLSMEHRLISGLGEERLEFLERDVKTKFMRGLRQALFATLAGPVSVRRTEQCASAVEDTLRDFIGMTVLDDRQDGVPLGHLVRLLTQAIPLAAKRGEPGTWIALAA